MLQTPISNLEPRIAQVETILVDLPFKRLQRFARFDARTQTSLLIRIKDAEGREGIGECIVPCGPWWSGDSIEALKSLIDLHLAPALLECDPGSIHAVMDRLDRVARGASFAVAGLEMALLDLAGKRHDVSVATLLGGARRSECAVAWPIASGTDESDAAEIAQKLEAGEASGFKMKMGAMPLEADLARARKMSEALDGRGRLIVDPNESWTEAQATAALPPLEEVGVTMVEQPVRRDLAGALVRLAARTAIPLMADESVQDEAAALRLACMGGAQVLSLKIMKAGGVLASKRMADIAWAGGVTPYMGTFLESSIGTAAGLQLAAVLPDVSMGGEVVGPMLLAEDIVTVPIAYRNGAAQVPEGPGLGIAVDEDRLSAFRRAE